MDKYFFLTSALFSDDLAESLLKRWSFKTKLAQVPNFKSLGCKEPEFYFLTLFLVQALDFFIFGSFWCRHRVFPQSLSNGGFLTIGFCSRIVCYRFPVVFCKF